MAPPLPFLHRAVDSVHLLAGSHGWLADHLVWMGWNTALAVIPLALALVLFRPGAPRTVPWAAGLVVFLLFLPNTPYVVTDVVHLFDDIRRVDSDLVLLGVYVPLYLAFFAVGFGSYTAALELARRHSAPVVGGLRWVAVEAAIHLVCATGIYLGRVVRLNSWDVFTRPRAVVEAVGWLGGAVPLGIVACTALVIGALTLALRSMGIGAAVSAARALPATLRTA